MTIEELLAAVGLSKKEASMYMTLLRHGTQPTSVLAKKVKMNRGTAYVILHALLTKGLVVKTTRRGIQYFAPLDPAQLLVYLRHQEEENKRNQRRVQDMMGQLSAISNPLSAKPKMEFFDGVEGARFVLNQTLASKDKTLRAFTSIGDVAEFVGPDYFNEYTDKRVADGYALHAIRTVDKDRFALATDPYAERYQTSKKERRIVRYAPDALAFPVTMYIYDNKLAILASKEEGFAMIIESKELAEMQKKIFELLWPTLPVQRNFKTLLEGKKGD